MTSDALLQEERRVQSTLATLGADYHALQHQTRCLENLKNFTKIRLGNIIDADMAQASIEYEAFQVKKIRKPSFKCNEPKPQRILSLFDSEYVLTI